MGTINRIKESLADLGDSIVNKTDEEEPPMGTDDLFEDNPPDDAVREKFDEEVKQVMGESKVQERKTVPMPDKIIDIEKTLETIAINGRSRNPYEYESDSFRYLLTNTLYENFTGSDAREGGGRFSLLQAEEEGWIEVVGDEPLIMYGKETPRKIKHYRINPKFIVWNGGKVKVKEEAISTPEIAPTTQKIFPALKSNIEKIKVTTEKIGEIEKTSEELELTLKELIDRQEEVLAEQEGVANKMKDFVREANPPLPKDIQDTILRFHTKAEQMAIHLRELDYDLTKLDEDKSRAERLVDEQSKERTQQSDLEKALSDQVDVLNEGMTLYTKKILSKNYQTILKVYGEYLLFLENFIFEKFQVDDEYKEERVSEQEEIGFRGL